MRVRAKHYRTGEPLDLVCERGAIQRLDPAGAEPADCEADWVAPAFCDMQINGCEGISFNSPQLTRAQVHHVVDTCQRHGVAQLCPTLVTSSFDALMHGLRTLRAACDEDRDVSRAIAGIHLEGPYISPDDGPRGAHPRQHVRPPSWEEFQRFQDEAARGMIKMVTLAPETEGALPFIEKLAKAGVVVAIGHTAASASCIRDAIRAGARMSTHLGNGSHAMLPRHDNYLWEQLAADELSASIIADGHHLPIPVMRSILRVKTPARLIVTCDACPLAGLPPGKYREWDQEFEILPAGKIVVLGTSFLAGSWAFTDLCVRNLLQLGETSLPDTIDLASNRPRALLGLPPRRMEVGEPAELILFDWSPGQEFRLRAIVVGDRSPLHCTASAA
ncbi:amidohydrolase family protein [Sorangium sp. So ce375]|uniref:N-acetylglucosamine-6-phosphate deacetylase n=1 Tax=Sorangium sp. So ce375 TaxID=3133306 RepID=UPI003F5B55A3